MATPADLLPPPDLATPTWRPSMPCQAMDHAPDGGPFVTFRPIATAQIALYQGRPSSSLAKGVKEHSVLWIGCVGWAPRLFG